MKKVPRIRTTTIWDTLSDEQRDAVKQLRRELKRKEQKSQ